MNEGVDRESPREAPSEGATGDPGEEEVDDALPATPERRETPESPESPSVEETRRSRRKRRHQQFRVPAWVILFLGPLTGWVIADMLGALLGFVIGVVAWRSRA